jgi:hypothetical protein
MRLVIVAVLLVALLAPAVWAEPGPTPTRCGLSVGLGGILGVPIDPNVAEESPYAFLGELELKWYLWKPFSLAGVLGGSYANGDITRMEWHDDWINLDRDGRSFWRTAWFDGILRVEIGRYWRFNPYVGGGGGVVYNTLNKKGVVDDRPVSDYYAEWLPEYLGLVGYDFFFNEYLAMKMEARWKFAPSRDSFVDETNQGMWQGLIGAQIYF